MVEDEEEDEEENEMEEEKSESETSNHTNTPKIVQRKPKPASIRIEKVFLLTFYSLFTVNHSSHTHILSSSLSFTCVFIVYCFFHSLFF